MSLKSPPQISAAAVEVGTAKADLSWDRALVGGFLAGAYIAFGSLVAISVSSGLDPKTWGTLPTLFTGAVFALGLILCIVAGAELLTGNMALLPIALLRRRITLGQLGINWGLVLLGNLAGSLFVAWVLAWKTGVIGHSDAATGAAGLEHARAVAIAAGKGVTESDSQIFLRAIGCNWLVCLAVWLALAADDVAGKILGIFFPIMAFVAMGFDHVVANMFFLPLGHFAGTPGLGWDDVANNLWWAFLGNAVGAGVFVAGIYWFLHLRGTPQVEPYPMGAPDDAPSASAPAHPADQARGAR